MNIAYITELTDQNFDEIVSSNSVVMVDVYADWCNPCKQLSPIVDELGSDYSGRVIVGKLDADTNRDVVSKLGVRSIPTIVIYKNGEIVEQLVGMSTKKTLSDLLDKYLS